MKAYGQLRILDLFCKAGGASVGYHQAFPDAEIVGVDIEPQPNYPYTFIQADAMAWLGDPRVLATFDLVHASPPCHDHSTVTGTSRKVKGEHGTGWMLDETVRLLAEAGVPYVVENVQGAKMPPAPCEFRLCGSSFLLDLRRHRKFVSSHQIVAPPCAHGWQTPRFQSLRNDMRKRGQLSPVVGVHGSEQYPGDFEQRCAAMRINWMTNAELAQAIPPAFTQWIGQQLQGRIG